MEIVLAHSHVNTLGGGERSVLEVARALRDAHDVRLLLGGFDPRRTYPELASFPHRRVGRLEWPLARVAADAIITNSFGSNLLAVRNSRRVVYWVHSLRSIFLSGRVAPALLARRAVDWLAVRRAARLIANSRYTARKARQIYGRDVDAVVYPGVDLQLYRPGPGDGRYAITVGRISPEKGLDALLEVWRDLPDLPLHVVGAGPSTFVHELRQRAPSGVVWRGALAPTQVAEALRGAAVAVFAAREEEFGIAPLEAMACGLPVVGWSGAGLTETVIDGQTGYLARDGGTFRARVRLLFHDGALRAAFGAAARRRAEQFSWQRTADALVAVCAGLAEPRVGVPRP
jgi:glycosyltransferase involved in cell wall biosynthesis